MNYWSAQSFANKVIEYYERHGRKHLPWQQSNDPYPIWLSEVMLQQTQVTTVIPYFEKFIVELPTVKHLAEASDDKVMSLWSGLGYYSRARNLHKAAKMVMQQFAGEFPKQQEQLEQLPGVGRSTAGAIASFAFGQPTAILDGNVKRVLARCYTIQGWPGHGKVLKELWYRAEQNTPKHSTAKYNQAMMDIGALICTRSSPKCEKCPLSERCLALKQDQIALFPGKKAKKERPSKAVYWLVQINNGSVLLYKRQPHGIWGGLWSLPEIEQQETAPEHMEELAPFVHKFSHYDLHIQPLLVEKSPNIGIMETAQSDWFSMSTIADIGVPAPVGKLIKALHKTL